ncbi:UDP-glucuronate 4-epimerase 3 [Platanthera guangdongensis]|uniref:UDP-glucuronate 4-epimerase 3 n=1 Tax=Platanthera guangdongensis TaxID=2320717 RepID=A0ABR2MLN6_9ASPA
MCRIDIHDVHLGPLPRHPHNILPYLPIIHIHLLTFPLLLCVGSPYPGNRCPYPQSRPLCPHYRRRWLPLFPRPLQKRRRVVGLDNYSSHYDPSLKCARQLALLSFNSIFIVDGNHNNCRLLSKLFSMAPFSHILHLAAQDGVRHTIENPSSYVHSNIVGHVSLLVAAKFAERAKWGRRNPNQVARSLPASSAAHRRRR